MGPIPYALNTLKMQIPEQILNLVFLQDNNNAAFYKRACISLDEAIMTKLIRPRVLVDCNLVGSSQVSISLAGVPFELNNTENAYVTVFRIPKDKTQGRSIISAMSVSYGNSSAYGQVGMGAYGQSGSTAITSAGQALFDSFNSTMPISTARVELIAENTVAITDTLPLAPNAHLRCLVANDANMSHLQPTSYLNFADLVTLATKSFIYNSMLIQLDVGYLMGGQQLGAIKNLIESYSDTEQQYQTYLRTTWKKVSFMNDTTTHDRFMRMMIGSHR